MLELEEGILKEYSKSKRMQDIGGGGGFVIFFLNVFLKYNYKIISFFI